MNVFELGFVATPLIGAITGGLASASKGPAFVLVGATIGFGVGAIAFFGPFLLTVLVFASVMRRSDTAVDRPSPLEWLAGTLVVAAAIAAPAIACTVTPRAVAWLLHV